MAKLLKMLWEYMDLTVLPFFETWSAHIFGGWQRVCWCTNEAFNQASPTKEFWENCPQKKGGHIYGKNEGWAYLRKLLYCVLRSRLRTPGVLCLYAAEYPGSLFISIQGSCLPMSLRTHNPAVLFNRSREVCHNWEVSASSVHQSTSDTVNIKAAYNELDYWVSASWVQRIKGTVSFDENGLQQVGRKKEQDKLTSSGVLWQVDELELDK